MTEDATHEVDGEPPPELLQRVATAVETSSAGTGRTPGALEDQLRTAQDLVAHYRGRHASFEDMRTSQSVAFDEWLMNLPGHLVRAEMVAVGVALAEGVAEVDESNATMYLGDIAVTLAEAGHADLAAQRAEINLQRYPDNSWVHITSGYAFAPSDPARAERHLRAAIDIAGTTDDAMTVDEAYEHLILFLADQPGRGEDVDSAGRARSEWNRSRGHIVVDAVPVPAPARTVAAARKKVGRNEPCPCGSGQKFKRCCGR